MQTQVMFTLMPDEAKQSTAHLVQACLQAAHCYRNNQRVFIFTQDQQDAHQIDELLWSFDPDSFIPHNLVGEGPRNGAAVEISWQAPTSRRPILINLAATMPNFSNQFSQVIDFVPADDTLKQQARERFKVCRQWGFSVETQTARTKSDHLINS